MNVEHYLMRQGSTWIATPKFIFSSFFFTKKIKKKEGVVSLCMAFVPAFDGCQPLDARDNGTTQEKRQAQKLHPTFYPKKNKSPSHEVHQVIRSILNKEGCIASSLQTKY